MSDSPVLKSLRELPSYSWGDFDRLYQVKAAIRELEGGQLNSASIVIDAMRRDDRVSGCLLQRCEALPSLPFNFEEGEGANSKAAADEATENWASMASDEALTELQMWGTMLGVAFGQLLWDVQDGRMTPRLKVWHPRHAYWRWDTRAFHMVTDGDGVVQVTPGDGQWVVYTPYGLERAWMAGAVRNLYVPWLLRQWALRDWGRWSEVYGSPIRKVRTPAGLEESDKQRFLKEVAQLGANSTIRVPTSPDPTQQFDVELVEATSTGWAGFEKLLDKCETSIAIRLLGQNLSTEVQGGSHAAATVHANIRNDILQADSQRLAKCLREQMLKPWAKFNFGDEAAAPQPNWTTAPPEDKKSAGDALKSLGDGIASLFKAGAKPDTDKLLEKAGVPFTAPAEAPAPPPPPPMPGQVPGQPKPTNPNNPDAAKEEELSARPSGALAAQVYVDAVADSAKARGTVAMRPDVVAILTAVMHASSYEDLRTRLLSVYGQMEPAKLAEVIQRAMVLAELAGRLAVLEDT